MDTGQNERSKRNGIEVWDRETKSLFTEKVYGDALIQWTYGTPIGRALTDHILVRPWLSQAYGRYQDTHRSAHKIPRFVREFAIPMNEYEGTADSFRSFNEFFIRKFKPGARPFCSLESAMPAFAEARYFGFESIREDQVFPVKGGFLSAESLLGSKEKAAPFQGGPLLLARLCPVDYHRYHYPDDGRTLDSYSIHGELHSVNPIALAQRGEIFIRNERRVSILETRHFGKLAYIEVGALCVGKIVQSHDEQKVFHVGDEKGYFLFGGSTVIVLGEKGSWRPHTEISTQTEMKRETLVKLGSPVAVQV
jgi:phosphatidylserine decarboxylase